MARTHPPSLITLTAATLREEELIPREARVLVAVSGGPDSMALLHVLARLREKHGFSLDAHGIDHGLRPEAPGELDLAETFARSLEVPFQRTHVDVAPGGNMQERARKARYAALHEAAQRIGATRVATGHHADDRAETVLMRILRGAGPAGLAVLPPVAPFPVPVKVSAREAPIYLVRPLIRARRAAVEAHVARHHIPFAEDPSNGHLRYTRTRVRKELVPILASLDPRIVEHLCALADDLAPMASEAPGLSFRLPRATLLALERLVRNPGTSERLVLPGGLVATIDRAHATLRVPSVKSKIPRKSVENLASSHAGDGISSHDAPRGMSGTKGATRPPAPQAVTSTTRKHRVGGEKVANPSPAERGKKKDAPKRDLKSARNVKAAVKAAAQTWEERGVDQLDEAVARC